MMYHNVEEDVSLYYQLHGEPDAPSKVLFIMGWVCTHKSWDGAVSFFSQRPKEYQICVFDNRGIGFSSVPPGPYTMELMANDALKLADHIGWQKFHLVGASMGGMISVQLAVMAPERLLSLTLISTRAQGGFTWPTWKASWIIIKGRIFTSLEDQVRYRLQLQFPEAYLNSTRPDGQLTRDYMFKRLLERSKAAPPVLNTGLYAQLSAINNHHLTDKELQSLKEKKVKILVITGDQDEMILPSHSLKMKEQLGAELVVFEGVGHGVLEQCIDKIYLKIVEHFESISNSFEVS